MVWCLQKDKKCREGEEPRGDRLGFEPVWANLMSQLFRGKNTNVWKLSS